MPTCVVCGQVFGLSSPKPDTCRKCFETDTTQEALAIERQEMKRLEAQRQKDLVKLILTTETQSDLKIVKRLDVITAQAAFEINMFMDLVVGFVNPVGGRADEMEKQLDKLRSESLRKLKIKAVDLGANAVVGIDLDLSTVTIGKISLLMMMASGTAVVIE